MHEEGKVGGILAMGADLVVRGAKNAVRFFIDTQIEAELIDLKSDVNFLSINDI